MTAGLVNRVAFSVCELIGWKFLILMCWRIVSTALLLNNQPVPSEVGKPDAARVAAVAIQEKIQRIRDCNKITCPFGCPIAPHL